MATIIFIFHIILQLLTPYLLKLEINANDILHRQHQTHQLMIMCNTHNILFYIHWSNYDHTT